MTVPAARRDPRLRRFPLRRLRLPMANGTLSLVVPSPGTGPAREAMRRAAERGEEPPYWADVWPASVAIARWLGRRGDVGGLDVLDLGCGLGVPGAAAVRAGARVLFADVSDDALAFAAFNAGQQRSPIAPGPEPGTGPGELPGSCRPGTGQTSRAAGFAAVRHDWHAATLDGTFDLLVLADVTYRPVHHPPLLRHLRRCLRPNGLCVHGDPERRESDGFLRAVRDEFASWQTTAATHFDGVRRPVRLTFLARDEAVLQRWLAADLQGQPPVGPPVRPADMPGRGSATEAP